LDNFSEAELHVAYKLGNEYLKQFPYPHFYAENVFPDNFYSRIQENLPDFKDMSPIREKRPVKGYEERFVMCFDDASLSQIEEQKNKFWMNFRNNFLGGGIKSILLSKFQTQIERRFGNLQNLKFRDELLLVSDVTDYALGPHTDSPKKVITVLFYLPVDRLQVKLGTSIYFPKNMNFKCNGGPHYLRKDFEKIITMPFLPNSVFCFLKNEKSFHGVEKILDQNTRRWLLLYDVYVDLTGGGDEVSSVKKPS